MDNKIQSSKILVVGLLSCSILLNLFLVDQFMKDEGKLSWSREAAIEAEAVASISCSGHGRAFLDGSVLDGNYPICECNTCYEGPDCSQFSSLCVVDADGGNPLFLEPFWVKHAASSAVVVAGWHRMSYAYDSAATPLMSQELEKKIRKLHKLVGNAVSDNRFIVFGVGSTQLLAAAIYALSSNLSNPPAQIVASVPHYPVYQAQADMFRSVDFEFLGDPSLRKNTTDLSTEFIEIVTSPNNPDGQLNRPILQGSSAKTVYDHAYYWPHFTPIPAPADGDVMTFTLSKLTGHAGSRFGWALIKDEEVFKKMYMFITINSMGMSHDSQLRALKLLNVVLEGNGKEIHEFGYETMRKRWEVLRKTLSSSKRFSLQETPSHFCSFSQKVRELSPAFAWVKCEGEEEVDCTAMLLAGGIIGRGGSMFGAEKRYVRLSVLRSQDDFDILIQKLEALVSEEDGVGAKTIGNPMFLEPFWMKHAAESAIMVAGWHRMGYSYTDNTGISQELKKQIHKLHRVVGNAITDNRFMVFGAGSTQLLIAAVYALSSHNSTSPARIVASVPFYPVYELQPELFRSMDFKFEGDTSMWRNASDMDMNFIEFVTSPNNPDGLLKKELLTGSFVKTIHDHAYYWPHFSPITAPANEDFMIFTMSKLTGHAGSRFGWALIKDEGVYEKMYRFLELNSMGVSRDTQLRALKLLQLVLDGDGKELHEFGYETMRKRWEQLKITFSVSTHFSLQQTAPQYCTFFQKAREASPAYAWVTCEREEDKDCYAVLKAKGIKGRSGARFHADKRHVRLSLIKSQDDFNILIQKLENFISEENGTATAI
ncbi:Alliinase, EGF-like domain [Dillenia turbinata]|uniref:Alliinase, EGF-like domain n=1 Tax=Dillenia turbinata TaxID=194707 RepID=A0AAN8ZMW1_9MAGN